MNPFGQQIYAATHAMLRLTPPLERWQVLGVRDY
jgi:hypothetical protein